MTTEDRLREALAARERLIAALKAAHAEQAQVITELLRRTGDAWVNADEPDLVRAWRRRH